MGRFGNVFLTGGEPDLHLAHCHIAEHMQSGMMFSFTVARTQQATKEVR
jgi:hypothetical protein